jgi:hypothetical protein
MAFYNLFFDLYRGLKHAHGIYILGKFDKTKKKQGGNATTTLIPQGIEDREQYWRDLWKDHLEGKKGLGVIPIRRDGTAFFGAVDIDDYSVDLKTIERKIKGQPLVICRTKSGGAHVCIFGKEPLHAKQLKNKLHEIAASLGYPGAEIFPKQTALANDKDVGNWINMPYFNGDRAVNVGIKNGKALSMKKFLEVAEKAQITNEQLADIKLPRPKDELEDGPPCLNYLCAHGFPAGLMNNSLFSMGVYARKRYGDDWEKHVEEYNQKYMGPGSSKEVQNIIKQLSKQKYFYKCKDQPLMMYCQQSICKRRKYGIGGSGGEEVDEIPYVIGTLHKIDTKPPMWFMDVDGHRVELTTEDLLSQQKFRRICVEQFNKLPPKVKPMLFEQLIQEKLEEVEVVVAPRDAGAEGQFLMWLESYCRTASAENREGLLRGKHFTERGRVYFRSVDLFNYLKRNRFMSFTEQRMWTILKRNGAEHGQWNMDGKCVTWWSYELPEQHENPLPVTMPEDKEPF